MNVIAEVYIAHPDLALTPTIRAVPEVSVQVVPHSGTDPETGMFFFLVEGESEALETFDAALEADHTVAESVLISESASTRIYRLSHPDGTKLLSPKTVEVGGLMLEAESDSTGWSVRLQLPDRESLTLLWEYCEEEGIAFELKQLYRQDEWTIGGVTGLTEAQEVALLLAYERGYFSEPRETSLEDLAEALDISPTAVGGRLRRGTAKLIEATFREDRGDQTDAR
ncbi:helix-turn-helix domain-containing protein [Halomarina pelagica]|uniref:helix-turn-helix domain-containing protein n=1 Tax=Halomarina pelagica TaxID=2961599 RepID=UPI0020C544DE|nr:helix-turn-helix domain-containing protein [Halomarina sp. BND7]